MTERIIKTPMEATRYVDQVRTLGDANRPTLGFLRSRVYAEAAAKGRLWIAVSGVRKNLTGYLLFGGAYPHLRVVQMFVHPEFRSQGVARTLIEELKRHGEETNHQTVSARVATELPANGFWQRQGFRVVRQVPGGKTTGRTLNIYLFELDAPMLFREYQDDATSSVEDTREITYPSRPILQTLSYVVDLNFFFDAVRNRDTGEAARILSLAFNSEIRLSVTPEFVRELERHSQDFDNDPVLEFAKRLPTLPELRQDILSSLAKSVRNVLSPNSPETAPRSANVKSDLIHLAFCIHHKAYGFITRDIAILRHASELYERFGLRVVSPTDLSESYGDVDAPPAPMTVPVGRQDLRVSELDERDRREAERFLDDLGTTTSDAVSCLAPGTTQSPRMRLVVRAGQEMIGIGSWPARRDADRGSLVYLYINEDHPDSDNAIGCLLEYSIDSGEIGRLTRLDLRTNPRQIKTREVALARGFRRLDRHGGDPSLDLTKFSFKGVITTSNWLSFRQELATAPRLELPAKLPQHEEMMNTGVVLTRAGSVRRLVIPLFEFETLISPGELICPGRPAVMVPIREEYANELLTSAGPEMLLFPKEAALRLEKAYFSGAGRQALLAPGKIVIFYVSRTRKEAVAAARITFSGSLTKTQAVLNLGRQGVLTEEEIHQRANRKGEVTAFTFDNVIVFPTSITYRDLKEMGCVGPANLVTAEALSYESLRQIVERAFEAKI